MRPSRSRFSGVLVSFCLYAASAGGVALAQGAPGPSYAGVQGSPSAAKAQSKLWWNDGSWWGCLWSVAGRSWTIHRLDAATETWIDTGTAVGPRSADRADCLWDGAKLCIATNRYTNGAGQAGHALELHRFGYDPDTGVYALDAGFPVAIGDASTEVLTLERDSTGRLWAAWTAQRHVWVAHTLGDDRRWSLPALHPRIPGELSGDDVCALVAVPDGRLALLWSDQPGSAFRCSLRGDADAPADWGPAEVVVDGPGAVDDQLSVRAARDGRLFAALKSATDFVLLAERGVLGGWSLTIVAPPAAGWSRPLLVLDDEQRVVHLFGVSPGPLGAVYHKSAPMDAPAFGAGVGAPILVDPGQPAFADPTSTKQAVDGRTGLVVLASHRPRREYGHHHDALGGTTPAPPLARFAADEPRGPAPLRVRFLDDSGGDPTQWSWSFGDGATSAAQHPVHEYAQPGRYTVTLDVANALGSDRHTRTELITVDAPRTTLTLAPLADGHVRESRPDSGYGDLPTMRVRDEALADYEAYLAFAVPPGRELVSSAFLRLACIDGSPDGGALFLTHQRWNESTLTWNRRPELPADPVTQLGSVATGEIVSVDLSAWLTERGTASLGLRSASSNSAYYSTRQGASPPRLELGLLPWPAVPPQPLFEQRESRGIAPLTVQFHDASSGPVQGWSWDFGDGSGSSLQNPSHVYAAPGTYTVSLTVTGPSGAATVQRVDAVVVQAPGRSGSAGAPGTSRTVPLPSGAASVPRPSPSDDGPVPAAPGDGVEASTPSRCSRWS
ncbi:MAG TPA: PKD domain-containing protein [Planctomycetota bacterium]